MIEKCIASWSKIMPDYEIICWDETNLDINKFKFAADAYKAKKYAFFSDVHRFDILYSHGGIFLDADVEVLKPFDELLKLDAFSGYEHPTASLKMEEGIVNPGNVLAAKKGAKFLLDILDIYGKMDFGAVEFSPIVFTKYLREKGLEKNNEKQIVDGITIFPTEYFCPIVFDTKKKILTEKTFSIHYFTATWSPKWKKIARRVLGNKTITIIKKMRGGKKDA